MAVAKLAGIPEPVIQRAKELLEELETRSTKDVQQTHLEERFNPTNLVDHIIHKELEQMDISHMTPLEALNKLADLKEKVKVLERDEKMLKMD